MEYISIATANLTDIQRAIITKHLVWSGTIQKLVSIRIHIIDQVHKKRSRCLYHVEPHYADAYNNILYTGRKYANPFPSIFKCKLENLMFREGIEAFESVLTDAFSKQF